MTPEELQERLHAIGLHAYWQAAQTHVRNAIHMQTRAIKTLDDLPLGASRIGGVPDLPPGVDWPMRGHWPLSFIAQINLAESHPFDTEQRLPARGMLYLFYDTQDMPWGFDPKDCTSFKVLYLEVDASALVRTAQPEQLIEDYRLDAAGIQFDQCLSLPSPYSHSLHHFTPDEAEIEALRDWQNLMPKPAHQLLGHSDNIQGNMELECQLVSHGLYCGDETGYQDPRAQTLAPGASDWLPLMQIDSDDLCNWMWCDCGILYVWIRQQDLAARNFDNCWVILQCF